MRRALLCLSVLFLAGCEDTAPDRKVGLNEFLVQHNHFSQRLGAVAAEANWKAAVNVSEQNTGERIGAEAALASFRGSPYVIDSTRKFFTLKQELSDLEFRQLDKILLLAAESPGTIPDVVQARIAAEARAGALLDGFTYCRERNGERCAQSLPANEIDDILLHSTDLKERRKVWEISRQPGPQLKKSLADLRDLRNRAATELGYSSYFHLQVADYGMSVAEMMQLMEQTVRDLRPLYEQLHLYARRHLAQRYSAPVPAKIPAHWLGDRWGEAWPGMVEAVNLDEAFRAKPPQWFPQQAERFYTSLGFPPLPRTFWQKSDLYQLPADSPRRKSAQFASWHIDLNGDVRLLLNITPGQRWFETCHHEFGHIYYFMAYSNPRVPVLLREGANRAFHEAVGDLIVIAARQPSYLRETGILGENRTPKIQWLLNEALDNSVVSLPFAAGAVTHFEHELYEGKLRPERFNERWWELAGRFRGIEPPAPRGEEFCDPCSKPQIFDAPARYYDRAIATLIKYQLHDYIARKILKQHPHECNYYGRKEVGRWLWEILSLGATRDWRQVLREKTGEPLSSRAMLEYFRPLEEHLRKENEGHAPGW